MNTSWISIRKRIVFHVRKMMTKIFSILFTTIILKSVSGEFVNYENYKVYKIVPETDKDVELLRNLETQGVFQFWSDVIKIDQDVRIMVAPEKQSTFETYSSELQAEKTIVIDDVQKLIKKQLERPTLNRFNNNYDWNFYQTLEEIYNWMEDIVSEHSDVAEMITIGRTFEGRDIKGVVIDYKKQEQKTIGMLEGGIHAREWISPATMTYIIHEFLTSSDADVRALAENIVWHIFPVVNPDGYVYTFTNNRLWRKNRNPVSFRSCSQWGVSDDISNGIDLNRNFGFVWMSIGASDNSCSEVYAGPVANSELETTSIINHVRSLKNNPNNHFVYYFAFHSFSQMVLVPYSHVSGHNVLETPNYADMYEIAIRGAEALKQRNNTDYIVGTSGDILYYVSGSSFDWAKGEAEIPIVYLFELRDVGEYGFLLPPQLILDNNREIVDALLEMDKVTRKLGYYERSNGVSLYLHNILLLLILFTVK